LSHATRPIIYSTDPVLCLEIELRIQFLAGTAQSVVCDAAKSNVPALGYTGAHAFANVILTLAGTLIMLIQAAGTFACLACMP